MKIDEVIAENRFRTVASPGVCERLAVLIDARRQYILLVGIIKLHASQFTLTVLSFYHCSGSSEVHLFNTKTTILRL